MNIDTVSPNRTKRENGLFVKKIKTAKHYYVYDVCSNEIIKVNRLIWDMIDQVSEPSKQIYHNMTRKYKESDILSAYNSIEKSISSGAFGSNRPRIRSYQGGKKELLYLFENAGMRQLIINLTNRCNMRCHYCIYSGKYRYMRTHGDGDISREIAIKAVDFFIKNCTKKERPYVTFYGGEPFIKFDLFKEIIDHVKSYSNNFHFSLTTNGTLLNDEEICSYIIDNDISLNVSLDGPKHIHDKNRRMVNGTGTFDLIMENLKRIKEIAPGYFKSRIYYSPVVTPPYNYDEIKYFFYESEFFKDHKNPLNIANVSTYATTLFDDTDKALMNKQLNKSRAKMLKCYKNALISGRHDDLTLEKFWFHDMIGSIHFREKTPLKEYLHVIGQCIPGVRRLFVSVAGKYYMCEKVGEFYPIGDVHNGINYDRICDFFVACDSFFKGCGNCWAVRLCKRCFADINCEDRFDITRKEKSCKSKIEYYETLLSAYCEILEKNPDGFEDFRPEEIFKD